MAQGQADLPLAPDAVAAAISEGDRGSARGASYSQGETGIGKTSGLPRCSRRPLRNDFVKRDHHMDAATRTRSLRHLHWIVEIGELDSSFKKDVARLKGFLTNDCDKLRRPYARGESEYPRRTVFAATVNDDRFLVDNTGNTRWWTIPVKSLDYEHRIDMQQVFAELAMDFDYKEKWWLDEAEEAELAKVNLQHRTVSGDRGTHQRPHRTRPDRRSNGKFMTAIEVLRISGSKIRPIPSARSRAALRDSLVSPKRVTVARCGGYRNGQLV